jgi:hypothetical protein
LTVLPISSRMAGEVVAIIKTEVDMISAQERETLGRRIEGPFACLPGGRSNGGVTDFLDDTTSCPLACGHRNL